MTAADHQRIVEALAGLWGRIEPERHKTVNDRLEAQP
jgi:hypothetical protein